MRLLASIRPPWHIVAHLESVVRPERATDTELAWTYPAHWRIHLAGFGDIARADVPDLCEHVAERVAELPAPRLWFESIAADDDNPADGLWVGVAGETAVVGALAAAIPGWVRSFGLLLDRRAYRPRVQLARVGHRVTPGHVREIADRLDGYRGRSWVSDCVTLGHEIPAVPHGEAGFAVVHEAFFQGRAADGTA